MVSSENEFNIVTKEMVNDSIDEFEECIEKIKIIVLMNKKKEISIILKSLYNITK